MKFTFRFESILKIRRHQEKKEKQKLGTLLGRKAEFERHYHELLKKTEGFEGAFSESGRRSVMDVRRQYEQQHNLQKELWNMQRKFRQVEEEITRQRNCLMEANKKTRMLEKLESREKIKFIQHQQQIEQLQQNEIATQMYNRTR